MRACTPNSRRSRPGCPLLRSSCRWPCTFTKHTIQTRKHTHACMHTLFQEVTARLPAAAFFLPVSLHIHQTYHTNTHMHAHPPPGGHGPAACRGVFYAGGLAHSPNIPHKHANTHMRARPLPGGHGPAARCCVLFTSGLAHLPNIPYKHTHARTPNSRRSWPGCLQMSFLCWWPCTFTKHTT